MRSPAAAASSLLIRFGRLARGAMKLRGIISWPSLCDAASRPTRRALEARDQVGQHANELNGLSPARWPVLLLGHSPLPFENRDSRLANGEKETTTRRINHWASNSNLPPSRGRRARCAQSRAQARARAQSACNNCARAAAEMLSRFHSLNSHFKAPPSSRVAGRVARRNLLGKVDRQRLARSAAAPAESGAPPCAMGPLGRPAALSLSLAGSRLRCKLIFICAARRCFLCHRARRSGLSLLLPPKPPTTPLTTKASCLPSPPEAVKPKPTAGA